MGPLILWRGDGRKFGPLFAPSAQRRRAALGDRRMPGALPHAGPLAAARRGPAAVAIESGKCKERAFAGAATSACTTPSTHTQHAPLARVGARPLCLRLRRKDDRPQRYRRSGVPGAGSSGVADV
jgi:hypothetical protein